MSPDYFNHLISQYRSKGLLVDANLLLLYFVGVYDPGRIATFKRTSRRGFGEEEFKLLSRLLAQFETIITTPNVLTEVSNLSNQLSRDDSQTYYVEFAKLVPLLVEHYSESKEICNFQHFKNFGLTDSGIINLASGKFLVLTDDGPLFGYLQNVGIDVINFNHVRLWNWGTA